MGEAHVNERTVCLRQVAGLLEGEKDEDGWNAGNEVRLSKLYNPQ
jgi:hypothetical protein